MGKSLQFTTIGSSENEPEYNEGSGTLAKHPLQKEGHVERFYIDKDQQSKYQALVEAASKHYDRASEHKCGHDYTCRFLTTEVIEDCNCTLLDIKAALDGLKGDT